ncbi:transposable element Tcb2 transposase [Trichonephila clavipes]|nr:transposable element Tcb2 transposase [Trichonephila clavipes]
MPLDNKCLIGLMVWTPPHVNTLIISIETEGFMAENHSSPFDHIPAYQSTLPMILDESRFSLSSDSHRILIWRERGSRNHPSNIIERDRYGGRGVLIWGGIILGSRTDLHIFDAGSVNGTRYCNEILPYMRLFRGAMGLQFLFMDNNAPCHRTVAAEQLLESEDTERMDWPARSPDLNPIEHV